jgi:hypothetical protein
MTDLVAYQSAGVAFGGLRGEVTYTDDAFDVDPDIQQMFYGDAAYGRDQETMAATESPASVRKIKCFLSNGPWRLPAAFNELGPGRRRGM